MAVSAPQFTPGLATIATWDGSRTVDAFLSKHLAIPATPGGTGWTVTHRPTGARIYLAENEEEAVEIASLVEQGLSNKEIAGALSISPATVKNHVHMILDKLNLPRRRMIMLESNRAPKAHQDAMTG